MNSFGNFIQLVTTTVMIENSPSTLKCFLTPLHTLPSPLLTCNFCHYRIAFAVTLKLDSTWSFVFDVFHVALLFFIIHMVVCVNILFLSMVE